MVKGEVYDCTTGYILIYIYIIYIYIYIYYKRAFLELLSTPLSK